MTPGNKSGSGAEKDQHSAENDKNSAENDEIKVPKKSAETGGNQSFDVIYVLIRSERSFASRKCTAQFSLISVV